MSPPFPRRKKLAINTTSNGKGRGGEKKSANVADKEGRKKKGGKGGNLSYSLYRNGPLKKRERMNEPLEGKGDGDFLSFSSEEKGKDAYLKRGRREEKQYCG